MCCALNRTNPSGGNIDNGTTADLCLENGLCLSTWETSDNNGTTTEVTHYYRDQCTSTDWADGGGCLNICTETTVRLNRSHGLKYIP
jgi:hypothetical protein